jgi:endonuclease/exonuclease/phosphatase family metal-dependent hydrolase
MAKAFSVASWNVQHFGAARRNAKPRKDVKPIIKFLADQKANVVAIYEVVKQMPGYQFHITEGPQSQEILIGVKAKHTAFFTQKDTFKSGASMLRPGALLILTIARQNYPLLFLHLKSLTEPKGFGLRDDITQRAIKFRQLLNKHHKSEGNPGLANFLFLGDLNTMGMDLSYSKKDISGLKEIERLKKRLAIKSVAMDVLDKAHPATWWPGSKSRLKASNLDHVVAAKHLKFKQFGGTSVDVRGWITESSDAKKNAWTKKFSDHCLLYFEVQKV